MGRKDLTLVDRNVRIVTRVANGETLQQVADDEGISKQRVSQICQEYQEEVPDDAYREVQRTQLEGYLQVVNSIIRNPGFVISPGGGIVCELTGELDGRGKPIPDPTRPLIDKGTQLKAVEIGIRVHERIAKAGGTDRSRQRTQDQSDEMNEFLAHVEQQAGQVTQLANENAQLRRQLGLSVPIPEAEIVT